jgi:hypothetical protein
MTSSVEGDFSVPLHGMVRYLEGGAQGLEAALAVSALLDVDAFRRAEDAPRIAVPWNNTTFQRVWSRNVDNYLWKNFVIYVLHPVVLWSLTLN